MTEPPPPPPSGDQPGDQPDRPTNPPASPPPPALGFPPPPPGYGAPPPAGAGQPPYGAPAGYGYEAAQAYGAQGPAQGEYAAWGQRVVAALLDYVAPFLVAGVLYAISKPLGVLVYLAALGFALYQAFQGGKTGQSFGKKTAGVRLLGERTGQPIGGGLGVGRYFLHIIDGLPCYLGYLWPLWDPKKQTFADKIMSTVVVRA